MIERDRALALKLLQSGEEVPDAPKKLLHSTLIGEEVCDDDEEGLVDYGSAVELLESALNDEAHRDTYVWVRLYLRSSTIGLPIQGDPDRLSLCMKRYGAIGDFVRLNSGGLLLEQWG